MPRLPPQKAALGISVVHEGPTLAGLILKHSQRQTSWFVHYVQSSTEVRKQASCALTTLGGVSQVLKSSHRGLCPLSIFFSFCDVEILGGGLFGSLCRCLNRNIMSQHPSKKINSNPRVPEWDKHTQENSTSHLTGIALLKSHLLQQIQFPKRTFSLEGQDFVKLLWVKAFCSSCSWYKVKHAASDEHIWICISTGLCLFPLLPTLCLIFPLHRGLWSCS